MTTHTIDSLVAEVAHRQHGAFSRHQVLETGGTDRIIDRRLAAGTWRSTPAEGVYRLRDFPVSWRTRLFVAMLATRGSIHCSHESAAALHGLASFPPGPVVMTVRHGAGRVRQVAKVHQLDDVLPEHIITLDGLATTTIARTVVDLAAVCRRGRVDHALGDALVADRLTPEQLLSVYGAVNRRGKPGMRVMRGLLAEYLGEPVPKSKLERRLLRVIRAGGLPRPALQYPFPGRLPGEGRVDAAYPDARLVIEADGRRWHTRKRDFAVDRQRDNETTLAGWRVLRFTWDDLTRRPEWVIAAIRRVLEAVPHQFGAPQPRV